MIKIVLNVNFVANRSVRVFTPSCETNIQKLEECGVSIFMRQNTLMPVKSYGYAETPEGTLVQIFSENPLTEFEKEELKRNIQELMNQSFYNTSNWGVVTFEFYIVSFA